MVRKINESNGNSDLAYANKIYDMACLVSDLGKAMENDKALINILKGIFLILESYKYSYNNETLQDILNYANSLNLDIRGSEFRTPGVSNCNFKYDETGFGYRDGKIGFTEDNIYGFWFTMEEAMENSREEYVEALIDLYFNEDDYDFTPQTALDCIKEEYENLKTYKSRIRKLYDYMLDIGA